MDSIYRILKRLAVICLFMLQLFVIFIAHCLWPKQAITPYDDPGSHWESESPYIVLDIGVPGNRESSTAYMEIDENLVRIDFNISSITVRTNIYTHGESSREYILMEANCHYYNDKIVINVLKDNVLGGKYKKIVLHRTTVSDPNLSWPTHNDLKVMYICAAACSAFGVVLLIICRIRQTDIWLQKVMQVFATVYEAIAIHLVLMCLSGENLRTIYLCATISGVCGIMILVFGRRWLANVRLASAMRVFAVALLVGAMITAFIAPFPEFYRFCLQ